MWKKILVTLGAALIGLVGGVLILGTNAPLEYAGALERVIPAAPGAVYARLIDVESLPADRPELKSIEVLERDAAGQVVLWKEHADMDGYALFRRLEAIPDRRLTVRLEEGTFHFLGTWTYELSPAGQGVRVKISENSRVDSLLVRAMLALSGRDAVLRQELDRLEQQFSGATDRAAPTD